MSPFSSHLVKANILFLKRTQKNPSVNNCPHIKLGERNLNFSLWVTNSTQHSSVHADLAPSYSVAVQIISILSAGLLRVSSASHFPGSYPDRRRKLLWIYLLLFPSLSNLFYLIFFHSQLCSLFLRHMNEHSRYILE